MKNTTTAQDLVFYRKSFEKSAQAILDISVYLFRNIAQK
jgi:hypothetical protein